LLATLERREILRRITNHKRLVPINAALDILPPRIRSMVEGVDILTEDPNFVGLHRFVDASYGRQYKDTAHVAYDFHQMHLPKDRRATTLVLPELISVADAVHELGHVLHEKLKFDPSTMPVSWYAKTNKFEAFAESFTAWVLPEGRYDIERERLYTKDRKTVDLFERLAG
jgi:hypothetical protein